MKKILIIRFSSIGDIVLTTPVIRCLKKQVDCEIHYLTKPSNALILEGNPYVDRVHVLGTSWSQMIKELKAERFDFIVDLHKNIRSLRVKLQLRKPSSTFKKLNFRKWLLVKFKINILPKLHVVDRYLATLKKFNIVNDGQGLDYFIPGEDEVDSEIPLQFKEDGYIAIATGSKHATKQLPIEKLIYVCQNIPDNIILLGDINDRKKGIAVEDAVGIRVFNACGAFNLNQSASVLKQARVILTGDTGLMHIASALRKPIISVWGNTVPEFGMYPYLPQGMENLSTIFEVKNLSCRPCSKLGYDACPKKHFRCMRDMDDSIIVEKIKQFDNVDL